MPLEKTKIGLYGMSGSSTQRANSLSVVAVLFQRVAVMLFSFIGRIVTN